MFHTIQPSLVSWGSHRKVRVRVHVSPHQQVVGVRLRVHQELDHCTQKDSQQHSWRTRMDEMIASLELWVWNLSCTFIIYEHDGIFMFKSNSIIAFKMFLYKHSVVSQLNIFHYSLYLSSCSVSAYYLFRFFLLLHLSLCTCLNWKIFFLICSNLSYSIRYLLLALWKLLSPFNLSYSLNISSFADSHSEEPSTLRLSVSLSLLNLSSILCK